MKLLFDLIATQPNKSKFHGGSEYTKRIFREIVNLNDVDISKIEVVLNPNRKVHEYTRKIIKDNKIIVNHIKDKFELQKLINLDKYTRFYSGLPYRYYDLDFSNIELYYTIHGLRPIEMPTDKYEYLYSDNIKSYAKYIYKNIFKNKYIQLKKNQYGRLLNKDTQKTKIFVPSKHTKFALINYFEDIDSTNIEVCYSPMKKSIDNDDRINEEAIKKYGVKSKSYILLISADRWIKNNYRAIKALDQLFSESDFSLDVVLLGVSNKKVYTRKVKNKNRYNFFDYVPSEDLEALYKYAYMFLYPTLNEGFGYPPLEAMKYGTDVAASSIASIPEICGSAIKYFNPYDIQEMKNRILNIYYESSSEKQLKDRYNFIYNKQEKMLKNMVKNIISLKDC